MKTQVTHPVQRPAGEEPGGAPAPAIRVARPLARPAQAIGAVALGALALGAMALGAVAIGKLVIGRVRVRRVEIGELTVRNLRVTGTLHTPPG